MYVAYPKSLVFWPWNGISTVFHFVDGGLGFPICMSVCCPYVALSYANGLIKIMIERSECLEYCSLLEECPGSISVYKGCLVVAHGTMLSRYSVFGLLFQQAQSSKDFGACPLLATGYNRIMVSSRHFRSVVIFAVSFLIERMEIQTQDKIVAFDLSPEFFVILSETQDLFLFSFQNGVCCSQIKLPSDTLGISVLDSVNLFSFTHLSYHLHDIRIIRRAGLLKCMQAKFPLPVHIPRKVGKYRWKAMKPCSGWTTEQVFLHAVYESMRKNQNEGFGFYASLLVLEEYMTKLTQCHIAYSEMITAISKGKKTAHCNVRW